MKMIVGPSKYLRTTSLWQYLTPVLFLILLYDFCIVARAQFSQKVLKIAGIYNTYKYIYIYMINEKTSLKITSVIFRLFANLLQTNLNKKCKKLYVIRIVTRSKEQ